MLADVIMAQIRTKNKLSKVTSAVSRLVVFTSELADPLHDMQASTLTRTSAIAMPTASALFIPVLVTDVSAVESPSNSQSYSISETTSAMAEATVESCVSMLRVAPPSPQTACPISKTAWHEDYI